MHIFSKILSIALVLAFTAPVAFAAEGIYNRSLVRGFLAIKGDFSYPKSDVIKFINGVTGDDVRGGKGFSQGYMDGHVEIGAEYDQLRTWFDVDFMPYSPKKGSAKWYTYGLSWMWGYKILPHNSFFNIIPSIGPGFELMNIRTSDADRVISSLGPSFDVELELRVQFPQLSVGLYGGYKVVRHDDWDVATKTAETDPWPYNGDINADKAFIGIKVSWTMLNDFQKTEKDLP